MWYWSMLSEQKYDAVLLILKILYFIVFQRTWDMLQHIPSDMMHPVPLIFSICILLTFTLIAIICSIIFSSWCIISTERIYQYKSKDWKMKTLVVCIRHTFQTQIWCSVTNIQNSNFIEFEIWIFCISTTTSNHYY